jgi:hypothetical protein
VRGTINAYLPNGSRDAVAPNAIREPLDINACEVPIVAMGMQGRDMAARLEKMEEGVEDCRLFDLLFDVVSDAATAVARGEDRFPFDLKRMRMVFELDGHS